MIQPSRRHFLAGLSSLIAAPAIVQAASLMPLSRLRDYTAWITPVDRVLMARWRVLAVAIGELNEGEMRRCREDMWFMTGLQWSSGAASPLKVGDVFTVGGSLLTPTPNP